jgi:hypothetical protein
MAIGGRDVGAGFVAPGVDKGDMTLSTMPDEWVEYYNLSASHPSVKRNFTAERQRRVDRGDWTDPTIQARQFATSGAMSLARESAAPALQVGTAAYEKAFGVESYKQGEQYQAATAAAAKANAELANDEARLIQSAISGAARNPTAAIYAQYLDGQMKEGQVWDAIAKHIAARLARLGISAGEGPATEAPGITVEGTTPWTTTVPGAEAGKDLVKRMVDAEIDRLRNTFSGFTPKRWQGVDEDGVGETQKDYETRIASTSETSIAPHATPAKPGYGGYPSPAVTATPAVTSTTATVPVGAQTQQQLNDARRESERLRLARERPWSPGDGTPPPLDPGLPFQADLGFMGGTQAGAATPEELSNLIRRERESTQEGRNLELLDFLNRTFNFGGLSPIVQRPLSRAVGSGADLTSQYFTQLFGQGSPTGQVPTQTFASFLQGGQPTAGNLQANLRNIAGQLGQGGDSPFLSTLQGTFGDPKDVFGAALQPGLKRVAPAVRGAFESQAGQQFQNVLAADPMRFKTPRESFRWFGNKGYF